MTAEFVASAVLLTGIAALLSATVTYLIAGAHTRAMLTAALAGLALSVLFLTVGLL